MNTTRPALSLGGILPDFLAIKDVSFGDLCCDRGALVQERWCSLSFVVYLTSALEHHQLACALTTHILVTYSSAIQVYNRMLFEFCLKHHPNEALALLVSLIEIIDDPRNSLCHYQFLKG
jgi:hypothetical protein